MTGESADVMVGDGIAGSALATVLARDGVLEPSEAQAATRPLDSLPVGVAGGLDVGHPQACVGLLRAAAESGATVMRGVGDVEVEAGAAPVVRYGHDAVAHEVSCQLIVGAEGRMSTVRRQPGIELHQTPARTLGADCWSRSCTAGPATRSFEKANIDRILALR